ncbi:unnamed protein product [Microthlaspi erraticum]|uniref:Uncharacterized protein n=1 Tax=Microthlaspi erraticum TaxID=1685480 RepID=A0A6D2HFJ9_9BRAS|nr:unnamed protein product [Microthlaspi erraticum]
MGSSSSSSSDSSSSMGTFSLLLMLTLLNLLIDLSPSSSLGSHHSPLGFHSNLKLPCFTLTTKDHSFFWFSFLPSPSQTLPHVLLWFVFEYPPCSSYCISHSLVKRYLLPSPLNILDCT